MTHYTNKELSEIEESARARADEPQMFYINLTSLCEDGSYDCFPVGSDANFTDVPQHLRPVIDLSAYESQAKVIERQREDAERWRALIGSQRIRILGTGGLGKDHQHMSLEIWDKFSYSHDDSGAKTLIKYVDTIRAREAGFETK